MKSLEISYLDTDNGKIFKQIFDLCNMLERIQSGKNITLAKYKLVYDYTIKAGIIHCITPNITPDNAKKLPDDTLLQKHMQEMCSILLKHYKMLVLREYGEFIIEKALNFYLSKGQFWEDSPLQFSKEINKILKYSIQNAHILEIYTKEYIVLLQTGEFGVNSDQDLEQLGISIVKVAQNAENLETADPEELQNCEIIAERTLLQEVQNQYKK